MLGKLAEVVEGQQGILVDAANAASNTFKEEYKEVYAQMSEIGKELSGVQQLIAFVEKEKIELDLKEEGVQFEKGKNIQLKFNYSPNVINIKLVDLSKSGKKATAVFTFAYGGNSTSREENVNVSSIIDQVYGLRDNIVQHTLAE
jgi:DNA polymerase III delta subunit